MARVWYVGTYPYREITPQDWDKAGLFGPHFQWSADNGWSVEQGNFRPAHLTYLAGDPEFLLDQEGPRPDAPVPPDDVTRPYKADASILKLVDDAFEALDLAESALENIQTSVAAANTAATQSGTFRNQAQTFRNEAETFKTAAGTSASAASTSAATANTKAGEASGSAAAAKTSETNSKSSETKAKTSETNSKTSETKAKTSETNAKTSETNAGISAGTASTKASEAQGFRNEAEVFRTEALSAKLSWKGPWSSGTAYLERDVVSHGGSSWWAKQPSTGVEPAEGASWSLVASRGEKGEGITSAADLTGALTDQVDLSDAMVDLTLQFGDETFNEVMPLSEFLEMMYGTFTSTSTEIAILANALYNKADVGHTHPVTDIDATGNRSSSNYLRGDGSWATPPNNIYTVPSQAEAEAGTATSARGFSAQRVRQAADAAITAREWVGTQAQYNAIGTKNPNITYYIVD